MNFHLLESLKRFPKQSGENVKVQTPVNLNQLGCEQKESMYVHDVEGNITIQNQFQGSWKSAVSIISGGTDSTPRRNQNVSKNDFKKQIQSKKSNHWEELGFYLLLFCFFSQNPQHPINFSRNSSPLLYYSYLPNVALALPSSLKSLCCFLVFHAIDPESNAHSCVCSERRRGTQSTPLIDENTVLCSVSERTFLQTAGM